MIGIVGAGQMGRALARAVAANVEPVLLAGGRRIQPPDAFPRHCEPARLVDVWRQARIVMLALPFPVALELMSGGAGWVGRGRTLIDVTNPGFTPDAARATRRSGGEMIARKSRTWAVAKAFNTVPAEHLEAVQIDGRPVSVPVAGAQPAKAEAFALARQLGFDPVDAGGIAASREVESLAMLLARISTTNGLHGRIGVHIGQPEPSALTSAASWRR